MRNPFRPDQFVTGVCAIDLDALRAKGVKAVLLDIDNTVLPQSSRVCPVTIAEWVNALPAAGFSVMFVSNNWHADVHERVQQFGHGVTAKAMKPLARGFREAARALGVTPNQCAVVGDQIFTDIVGGNLIGATTVLVQPLSTTDLLHTRVLRRIERLIMARRVPGS